MGFWVFLVHPTVVSVLLSALVERFFVPSYNTRALKVGVGCRTSIAHASILLHAWSSKNEGWVQSVHALVGGQEASQKPGMTL